MGRAFGTALLALGVFASSQAAATEPGSVASFPTLPEENPAPAAAPPAAAPPAPAAAPAPVGVAALPALEPVPVAPAPAAPAPPVAPPAPAFPAPALQPPAPPLAGPGQAPPPSLGNPRARPELDQKQLDDDERHSQEWMVALEAFTRVPLDMGVQAGVEFPIGLRLSAGYGWVPEPYMDFFTGKLAGANSNAAVLLREGIQSGRTLRLQAGFRPWHDLGFYADAGFANISLDGSIEGEQLRGVNPGTYSATISIDTWLLEIGYQAWVGRHFTLAAGLGLSGPLGAHSELSGAGLDPELAKSIARTADEHVEQYGILPALTLRLGFDMI